MSKLTILTFKWWDPAAEKNEFYRYTEKYVNVLSSMLKRHMTIDYELVCCTDNPAGLDPDIRVVDMPKHVLATGEYYPKLYAFHPAAAEIFGPRILMMDLDVIVVRDLAPLLDTDSRFKAWKTSNHPEGRMARFNTSFVLMDAGAFPQVWDRFHSGAGPEAATNGFEYGDQGWVSYVLNNVGDVWEKEGEGIQSWRPIRYGYLPPSVRVVFFNGRASPAMDLCQGTPWVKENWR